MSPTISMPASSAASRKAWRASAGVASPSRAWISFTRLLLLRLRRQMPTAGARRGMTMPIRLRLSRARGFDLQAHSGETNGVEAVNVARPGVGETPSSSARMMAARLRRTLQGPARRLDSARQEGEHNATLDPVESGSRPSAHRCCRRTTAASAPMAAPAAIAMASSPSAARLCASGTARRSQPGSATAGAAAETASIGPWWRGDDFGRRIIVSRLNQCGAFGNRNGKKPPHLSWTTNER